MIKGDLLLKAQNLVREWLGVYSSELQKMWSDQIITKLPPLVCGYYDTKNKKVTAKGRLQVISGI